MLKRVSAIIFILVLISAHAAFAQADANEIKNNLFTSANIENTLKDISNIINKMLDDFARNDGSVMPKDVQPYLDPDGIDVATAYLDIITNYHDGEIVTEGLINGYIKHFLVDTNGLDQEVVIKQFEIALQDYLKTKNVKKQRKDNNLFKYSDLDREIKKLTKEFNKELINIHSKYRDLPEDKTNSDPFDHEGVELALLLIMRIQDHYDNNTTASRTINKFIHRLPISTVNIEREKLIEQLEKALQNFVKIKLASEQYPYLSEYILDMQKNGSNVINQ